MRYRNYELEVTPQVSNVIGVSGKVVHSENTEKKAKAWIDREWNLSQEDIRQSGLRAWYVGNNTWNVATNDPIETVGQVQLSTTRSRIEDWSGLKKFKVVTRNELTVTLRITWNKDIVLGDKFVDNAGPKTAVKNAMKTFAENGFTFHARHQLEQQARAKGIGEWQIIDCWDKDELAHLRNLVNL
jgi:hypothetical protein